MIDGDGPTNARVVFIGEAPGYEENNKRRPFTGNTGKEFNDHYLLLAGLYRDIVYITNTVKCYPHLGAEISDDLVRTCSDWHLQLELETLNPSVVVLMGATAASLDPSINLEMHHGMPIQARLFGKEYTCFVMWHPAAGLHDTNKMVPIREDFERLGRYLRGENVIPINEHSDPIYMALDSPSDVEEVLRLGSPYDPLAIDTEWDTSTNEEELYCLTFSNVEGTGFLIKNSNQRAMQVFYELVGDNKRQISDYAVQQLRQDDHTARRQRERRLEAHRPKVIMHNMMADWPIFFHNDLYIKPSRVIDTMVMAYHLQNQPQALKILAYRLCGMVMREFEDVVMPYGIQTMENYIRNIIKVDWGKPEPYLIDHPDGTIQLKKPQGLNTKLKRMLTDLGKAETIAKQKEVLLKRWKAWGEEKNPVIKEFGEMPRPSIIFVPDDELIGYACPDADATLRVFNKLRRMRVRIPKVASFAGDLMVTSTDSEDSEYVW
jgi:uracil-DNA glycosylase family 4